MTNVHRERWDARANPKGIKEFDVDATVAIEAGDMVWQDGDDAKPVSSTALWTGSLAGTRGKGAEKFVGIAMSAKQDVTKAGKVRVGGRGVYSMPCDSATFEVGDLVTFAQDGANNYLKAQHVVKLADSPANQGLAIGRVVKRYANATTLVEFEILGAAEPGGGRKAFLTS
jgi:hypothetical protein